MAVARARAARASASPVLLGHVDGAGDVAVREVAAGADVEKQSSGLAPQVLRVRRAQERYAPVGASLRAGRVDSSHVEYADKAALRARI